MIILFEAQKWTGTRGPWIIMYLKGLNGIILVIYLGLNDH